MIRFAMIQPCRLTEQVLRLLHCPIIQVIPCQKLLMEGEGLLHRFILRCESARPGSSGGDCGELALHQCLRLPVKISVAIAAQFFSVDCASTFSVRLRLLHLVGSCGWWRKVIRAAKFATNSHA